MRFDATDRKVREVLFSTSRFRIPRYQRPYAWTNDQVTEFWQDLVEHDEPYFIGSVILNYEREEQDKVVDIIDGQQRMLTITMFAAALRNVANEFDSHLAGVIQRHCIMFEDLDGNHFPRIKPGDSTCEFFKQNIQTPFVEVADAKTLTPEEKRLKDNYLFLENQIRESLQGYEEDGMRLEFIKSLRNKVSDLIIIEVHIYDELEAYEIFETTNARGVDLSVADLLKNVIFKQIRENGSRDVAKEKWQEIEANVNDTGTEMKKFLRYYWISRYPFVTERNLFRDVKKKVVDWGQFLDDLHKASQIWELLLVGDLSDFQEIPNGPKMHDSVLALRVMGVTQCFVFLMAILRNLEELKMSPLSAFRLIENFTYQYSAVCKLPANVVEKIYSKYSVLLEREVSSLAPNEGSARVQTVFNNIRTELLSKKPSRDQFLEQFAGIEYKNSAKSRILTKYMLSRINDHYSPTEEHKLDFEQVNIEHILPGKPDPGWGLTQAQIKPYVNRLGNLTLLSKKLNSKAQNHTLDKKIGEFRQSQIPLTRELVRELEGDNLRWGERQIISRQSQFASLAYEHVWKLG